jgi:hypothetical protein
MKYPPMERKADREAKLTVSLPKSGVLLVKKAKTGP